MDSSSLTPMRNISLSSLAGELTRLETVVEAWTEGPRDTVRAYREAIDALHAEALRRLVRALRGNSGAAAALREAAADDVVYAVLRHHGIVKPSIAERIERERRRQLELGSVGLKEHRTPQMFSVTSKK